MTTRPGDAFLWERFKLTVERGRPEYVHCRIYTTEKAMESATGEFDGKPVRHAHASFISYKAWNAKGRVTPDIGALFFHKEKLEPFIVAHELTHAALHWSRLRRLDLRKCCLRPHSYATDAEERVAEAVGYMMEQWYAKQRPRIYFITSDGVRYDDLKAA